MRPGGSICTSRLNQRPEIFHPVFSIRESCSDTPSPGGYFARKILIISTLRVVYACKILITNSLRLKY
jgi:hypothetical protein